METYVLSIPSLPEACCPYIPIIMVAGAMSVCLFCVSFEESDSSPGIEERIRYWRSNY